MLPFSLSFSFGTDNVSGLL
jgi:hypothetical protein